MENFDAKILVEAEVICEPMNIGYLLVYVIFVSYGKCDPNLCEPKKIDSHSSQISHLPVNHGSQITSYLK
jgi:hypothetical protein